TPERIRAIAAKADELGSETLMRLKEDHERVRERSGKVKQQVSRLVDLLAEGKTELEAVRKKLESLEAERKELESIEVRLKTELEAEQTQQIAVDDQLNALSLFNELV